MTIREVSGSSQTSRPITFGRPFKQGDIASYPRPRVNGIAASLWQADVKNRWDDGSVKFAIISFHSDLPASSTIAVDFENTSSACHLGSLATCQAAALDAAGMLAMRSSNWTATIEITNGTTQTANARTMINAGHFSYWLQGPVATQMVVEDLAGRTYEMGFASSILSLHPKFWITAYPNYSAGIRQEFLLENGWTDRLLDQTYSLAIKNGTGGATTVYSRFSFTHPARARWHKGNEGSQIWDGTAPGAIEIDHNHSYIIDTKAIPNYNNEVVVDSTTQASLLSTYNSFASYKDLNTQITVGGSPKNTNVVMAWGATGGRPDIGFVYEHQLQILWNPTSSLYQYFYDLGTAAAYPPIHFREHRTDNFYCQYGCTSTNATVPAYGKPLWVESRRTLQIIQSQWASSGTVAAERLALAGTATTGGWSVDVAHIPSIAYLPYLVSGSNFLYEEILFWANWAAMYNNPGSHYYGRNYEWGIMGPAGGGQMRGQAWTLRLVAQAAFVALDDSPERESYRFVLRKNAEAWEGVAEVTAGNFPPSDTSCPGNTPGTTGPSTGANRTAWCWGRYIEESAKPNALGIPPIPTTTLTCQAASGFGWGVVDCGTLGDITWVPWQFGYWLNVAGWAEETYPNTLNKVLEKYAAYFIDARALGDPLQYHALGGAYSYVSFGKYRSTGGYPQTFPDYKAAFVKTGSTTTTSSMTSSSTSLTVSDYTQIAWKPTWTRVAADVSAIQVTSGTVRITFASKPHGLAVGDRILTAGHATAELNTNSAAGANVGIRYVTAVPSATSLEYTYVGSTPPADGSYAVTGTFIVRTPQIQRYLRIDSEVFEACKIDTDGSITIGGIGVSGINYWDNTAIATPCPASTLFRGRGGTTAASHSSGATISPAYDSFPQAGIAGTSHLYPWIVRSGVSFLRDYSTGNGTGTDFWDWLQTTLWTPNKAIYLSNDSPQWDVLPRSFDNFHITTTGLPAGTAGSTYSTTLSSSGGSAPVTWSVASGSLPAGLSLNASTGTISGTPSAPIAANVTFRATDSSTATRDITLGIGVATGGATITIAPTSLSDGTVGTAYSQTFSASGGTGPYSWAVLASTTPPGLSLSASGILSGTPTTGGTYNFTIRATDSLGNTKDQTLTLLVNWQTLSITTGATLPNGTIGVAYSTTLAATGGSGSYTWTLTGGTLTGGLSLNTATGVVSGTPNTPANYSFTVRVDSSDGQTASRTFSLLVPAPAGFKTIFKGIKGGGVIVR